MLPAETKRDDMVHARADLAKLELQLARISDLESCRKVVAGKSQAFDPAASATRSTSECNPDSASSSRRSWKRVTTSAESMEKYNGASHVEASPSRVKRPRRRDGCYDIITSQCTNMDTGGIAVIGLEISGKKLIEGNEAVF